jgi:hypothetical protein
MSAIAFRSADPSPGVHARGRSPGRRAEEEQHGVERNRHDDRVHEQRERGPPAAGDDSERRIGGEQRIRAAALDFLDTG